LVRGRAAAGLHARRTIASIPTFGGRMGSPRSMSSDGTRKVRVCPAPSFESTVTVTCMPNEDDTRVAGAANRILRSTATAACRQQLLPRWFEKCVAGSDQWTGAFPPASGGSLAQFNGIDI